jgi:hypothetical protein
LAPSAAAVLCAAAVGSLCPVARSPRPAGVVSPGPHRQPGAVAPVGLARDSITAVVTAVNSDGSGTATVKIARLILV